MPRHKKEVELEPVSETEAVVETAEVAETVVEEPKIAVESAWAVYKLDGTYVRTYSVDVHGPEASARATEFAQKINGTVKAA